MKVVKSVFAVMGSFVVCASAAAPIYEAKDVDVSSDAVRCRLAGAPVLAGGDAFSRKGFWTLANYDNRLGIEIGGVRDGARGLCLDGSAKTCDTAWSAKSGKIPLKGKGRRYRLGFGIDTTIAIKLPNGDGENWRSTILWYGADGNEIAKTPIAYSVPKGQRTDVVQLGDIPEGAASFALWLGFDWPNIGPANRLVFSDLSFEVVDDKPFYAPVATLASEVREGGRVAWCADVPGGCAVRFQWRGAPSLGELAQKPFVGPDGTGASFFDAPFRANARHIQYRVLLRSDGKATPALREVRGGKWTDKDWTLTGDVRPPRVRRVSPSPTRDGNETLRISVKDATSAVLWNSLKVRVDGEDRTAAFTRDGDVVSLAAPSGGWVQGLHTAEVCVVDFHGNRAKSTKMFYVGEAPTTPKVSLRDDGMTLIDGKPFFPIGMYAVCKRDFNGNSFDAAFKGLKEAGFNLAHTYGNSYDPDFLAAAAKYGFKLWVEARFPDRRLIEVGRHNPSVIAWYLGDDTSDHILPELEADYDEAVKAVDPTRLTVQADPILGSSGGNSRYADYVTATDGLLPEIYPVRNAEGDPTDTTCVAVTIRDIKQFHEDVRLRGDGRPRTCWAILQYFKGWENWKHFPSRDQLFATTFAAVVHGAHGVTWYTYGGFGKNEGVTSTPERWRNICDLATRLSELSPVLAERTPPQPAVPTVIAGPKTDPLGAPSVTCLLKRHAGKDYLLAVNAAAEPVSARLAVPGAASAEVLYENRTCDVEDGRITDDFAPFAVHVYRLSSLALVPAPRHMKVGNGVYAVTASNVNDIAVHATLDKSLPPEGYRLVVTTGGVFVASADAAGAFYARQTLRQLADGASIPCVEIEDSPAYRWRGVHLDEVRHFFGKENVKRILDLMAYHKLNVFHWHLTDDEGWRLEMPKYPELTRVGAKRPNSWKRGGKPHKVGGRNVIDRNSEAYGPYFYTADDVREILAYAAARHIKVVPETELPGHAGAAATAYPEFVCKPEGVRERIWNADYSNSIDVFCAGNDETVRFLEGVLDYVCELFPSKVIHIGGDECPRTRWKECPKCQARMKAEGMKDVNELQAWMTRHFADYLERKGRRIIGWDEILSGDVPQSAIGMSWRTSQKNGAGDKLTSGAEGARRGHDMVMTPHLLCYYDYSQDIEEDPFQYIGGHISLEKAYSFDPCEGVADAAKSHVLGGQCNNWTEFTWNEHDLAWKMWPRTCAMAEALWTAPTPRDFAAFSRRMTIHRRRLIAQGVNCAPLGNR